MKENLNNNVLDFSVPYEKKIYCADMPNTFAFLKIDSISALFCINKQTASIETEFNIVIQIWDFYAARNLHLQTSYLESKRNKISDLESLKKCQIPLGIGTERSFI